MPTDIVVKPKEWQTTIVATEIVMQWKVRKTAKCPWGVAKSRSVHRDCHEGELKETIKWPRRYIVNQKGRKTTTWSLSMKMVHEDHRDCRGRRGKLPSGYGDSCKAEGVENC